MNEVLLRAFAQLTGNPDGPAVHGGSCAAEKDAVGAPTVISTDSGNSTTRELADQGYTRTHKFAVLPSRSEPRWLLPLGDARRTREGFRIYTPYAPVARILKNVAVTVIEAGWTGWSKNQVLLASRKPLPIEDLVREVTGERDPIFALSLGAPGKYRKLTVQVMRPGSEILGYIKLPLTEAASGRIRREASALQRLWNYPELRPHLPKVLHTGEWESGHLLFQTGGPAGSSQTEFSPIHDAFLKSLWKARQVVKPAEVIIKDTANRWLKAAPRLSDERRALGDAALEKASSVLAGTKIACGIMHGDFTPWNTRAEDGRLFVYDWETIEWEAPNLWDVFHFHLQVESLLNRKGKSGAQNGRSLADRASFWLYLLRSISQNVDEAAPGSFGAEFRFQVLARENS